MRYDYLINHTRTAAERAFRELELTGQNITNIDGASYKAKRLNAFDEEMSNIQDTGQITVTEDKRDITLDGAGFFELKGADGKVYLTRNLHLQTDKDHNLVSNGKYIIPPGKLDLTVFKGFEVEKNGEILGITQKDNTKIPIGHLKVINYPDSSKLKYDGQYWHANTSGAAGKPYQVQAGPMMATKVRQGAQERSNVDMAYEFTAFSQLNNKLRMLSTILLQLNQSKRSYIQTLGQAAG